MLGIYGFIHNLLNHTQQFVLKFDQFSRSIFQKVLVAFVTFFDDPHLVPNVPSLKGSLKGWTSFPGSFSILNFLITEMEEGII